MDSKILEKYNINEGIELSELFELIKQNMEVTKNELSRIKSISVEKLPNQVYNNANEVKNRILRPITDEERGLVYILNKRVVLLTCLLEKIKTSTDILSKLVPVIRNILQEKNMYLEFSDQAIRFIQDGVELLNVSASRLSLIGDLDLKRGEILYNGNSLTNHFLTIQKENTSTDTITTILHDGLAIKLTCSHDDTVSGDSENTILQVISNGIVGTYSKNGRVSKFIFGPTGLTIDGINILDTLEDLKANYEEAKTYTYRKVEQEIKDRNAAIEALKVSLIDGAPQALDTLLELSGALGDDPNFATTVINLINQRYEDSKKFTEDNFVRTEDLPLLLSNLTEADFNEVIKGVYD